MDITVILILIGMCLLAGSLLYLPFFLWFRYRRRSAQSVAAEVKFTRAGYVFFFVEMILFLGGFATSVVAPESTLGSLTEGIAGQLRWMAFITVAFGVLGMVLRRAGVVLERPKTNAADPSVIAPGTVFERRGRVKVATVRGAPVFIHWSVPLGGVLVACLARAVGLESVFYCLAFVGLIAVHEFGHFGAARLLGLKVFAVDISGWGGRCFIQAPRSIKHAAWVYCAGLMAQAALLLLTLGAMAIFGAPESVFGRSVVVTFIYVNLFLFVVNLVPAKIQGGVSTDGEVLWELFLHVFKGRPHPLAKYLDASPVFSPETRLLTIEGMIPPGFTTGIEVLNDDTTPMDFVIEMLEKHVKLQRESAIALMLGIHNRGGVLLPLDDLGHAEAVCGAIMRDARDRGHKLICRAVDARIFEVPQ